MRSSGLDITGSYSRLTPRHPVALACEIVHLAPKKMFRKQEELLFSAEIIEISLTGAAISLQSVDEADRYKIGSKLTFRVNGLDGGAMVRHLHASGTGLRIGCEFQTLSPKLDQFIKATVANLRT